MACTAASICPSLGSTRCYNNNDTFGILSILSNLIIHPRMSTIVSKYDAVSYKDPEMLPKVNEVGMAGTMETIKE